MDSLLKLVAQLVQSQMQLRSEPPAKRPRTTVHSDTGDDTGFQVNAPSNWSLPGNGKGFNSDSDNESDARSNVTFGTNVLDPGED